MRWRLSQPLFDHIGVAISIKVFMNACCTTCVIDTAEIKLYVGAVGGPELFTNLGSQKGLLGSDDADSDGSNFLS